MHDTIQNIIEKNLPEKKEVENLSSSYQIDLTYERNRSFNQALSQINTSKIADEVLKATQEAYRIETMENINNIIWNKDGSLKSHNTSDIVSSVMHYFIR